MNAVIAGRSSRTGTVLILCLAATVVPSTVDSLLASPVTSVAPADTAEASVRATLERYYEDLSARDWPAFEDDFWPGATITTVWTPPSAAEPKVEVTTVTEFVARAPDGPGSREVFEEWPIEMDVRVSGNLAQAWVRFGARFGDPGDLAEWEGIDAFLLMRDDGEWRIASIAFTGTE